MRSWLIVIAIFLTAPTSALAQKADLQDVKSRLAVSFHLDPRLGPPLREVGSSTRLDGVHQPVGPRLTAARRWCPGRVAGGALLGTLAGGLFGVLHGAAGHPGLPHTGADIPSELEYSPFFALAGGIVGGILAGRGEGCA